MSLEKELKKTKIGKTILEVNVFSNKLFEDLASKSIDKKIKKIEASRVLSEDRLDEFKYDLEVVGTLKSSRTAEYISRFSEAVLFTLPYFTIKGILGLFPQIKAATAKKIATYTSASLICASTLVVTYTKVVEPLISENKLKEANYEITREDVNRGEILYKILENKFGYNMDPNGKFVPLKSTPHHPEFSTESFQDAFKRLNPNLYNKLRQREHDARRKGDTYFHHLRPGDKLRYYRK